VNQGNTKYIGILHGKLDQYLAEYFEDTDDVNQTFQLKRVKEMHRQMVHPLKIVTPFQILKYCYGVKGFEKGFTELAGAMLIFDEIHAYDVQTFAQIVTTLQWLTKHLQIRTMIMTATFPTFMLKELQYAVGHSMHIMADQNLLEQLTRHRVQIVEGTIFDQIPTIKKMLHKSKKVLVVCNTVANAQEIFHLLTKNMEIAKSVLLHSRFIVEHRIEKERLLFEKDIRLLVGTQAIEVSLDIDFDTMFTEPAPLDALIQRFGRVNRKCEKDVSPIYICHEGGEHDFYIYPEDTIARTLNVLREISVIKEHALQEMLDEVYPHWPDKNKYDGIKAGFMDSLQRLRPFIRHKEEEEAFYRRFTGISVLPVEFRKIYEEHIRQFDFIEAEKFFITIHQGMFYKLLKKELITKEFVEIKRGNHIKIIPYWVVNCLYCKKNGLLENKPKLENNLNI
jgi:CRISPR-associated endonuclease/helicase Cas3